MAKKAGKAPSGMHMMKNGHMMRDEDMPHKKMPMKKKKMPMKKR